MSKERAVLTACAAVLGAAVLGQLLAGDDPRARLDSLPTTFLSLPFFVWIVVAVAYYLIGGVIVFRLARALPERRAALLSYIGLMAANELWNFLLFGFDAVWPAALGMVAFAVLAVVVGLALWSSGDRGSFWIFAPYLIWVVGYDVPWVLLTWLADR